VQGSDFGEEIALGQTVQRVQDASREQLKQAQRELEGALRDVLLAESQKWIENSRKLVDDNAQSTGASLDAITTKNSEQIAQRTEDKKNLEQERDKLNEDVKEMEE